MMKVLLTDPGLSTPRSLDLMAQFVTSYHPYEWRPATLNLAWTMEVMKGDTLVALVWFTPCVNPKIIEAHACAHIDHRKRWLTRSVLNALWSIVTVTDADACVAQVTSPEIGRIWQRLGFTIIEPAQLAIMKLKE